MFPPLYCSLYARGGKLGFPRGHMRNLPKIIRATYEKKKLEVIEFVFPSYTSRKKSK